MKRSYPQNIQRTCKDAGDWPVFRVENGAVENADQTACKPGSVPPCQSRTRRPFLWTGHCWPVLATYPDGSGRRRPYPGAKLRRAVPIWSCSRRGLPCRPRRRVRGGLLPHPFTLTRHRREGLRRAVCFLWRYPWGRPRRALPAALSPWSPDFPRLPERRRDRPAV